MGRIPHFPPELVSYDAFYKRAGMLWKSSQSGDVKSRPCHVRVEFSLHKKVAFNAYPEIRFAHSMSEGTRDSGAAPSTDQLSGKAKTRDFPGSPNQATRII